MPIGASGFVGTARVAGMLSLPPYRLRPWDCILTIFGEIFKIRGIWGRQRRATGKYFFGLVIRQSKLMSRNKVWTYCQMQKKDLHEVSSKADVTHVKFLKFETFEGAK